MQRRKFITKTGLSLASVPFLGMSCTNGNQGNTEENIQVQSKEKVSASALKISLAQWSLHRTLEKGEMTNLDFPKVSKEQYGIEGIEYVNRFFDGKVKEKAYLEDLNIRASDLGVQQLLIMVDGEGGMAELDDKVRQQSIENHKKWIEAAKYLGCHSIRVNAYGEGTAQELHMAAVDGLGRLSEFASDFGINVIVENHGGRSSDGGWLSGVMKEIALENCGTLPDFGNFCIEKKDSVCVDEYDRYKGVKELMPYAKAVSAKSHDFDNTGREIHTDYSKMIQIVKDAGYQGFIGIEYEGSKLSEHEGILATKKLLEQVI